MTATRLRLGSFVCRILAADARYPALLASVFGTGLEPDDADAPFSALIEIAHAGEPPALPADRLELRRRAGGFDVVTDPLVARVESTTTPIRIAIDVRQPDMREDWLAYHFWLLLHRVLLALDRLVLHAAALQFEGRVHLFSGPKGAGKSTLSVALARAGATLLAEDHLLLTRVGGNFLVSGVNTRMRVTDKTEQHFLAGRLDMAPILVSGTPKKEFHAPSFFSVRAHEDFRPDRLFFNRIGSRFHVEPLTRRDALLRLIRNTADLQRPNSAGDLQDLLGYLHDVTARVPAFDLEVNDSLEDLQQLVDYLRV